MKKVCLIVSWILYSFSSYVFGSVVVVGENSGWELDEDTTYESMLTLRTPTITNSEATSITFEVTASRIDWKIKTSSEEGYDKLIICIDPESGNESYTDFSGEYDWRDFSHEWGEEGNHTVKITYSKDGSVARGEDCCWIWFEGMEEIFKEEVEALKRWEFSDGKVWEFRSDLAWYESWNSGVTPDYSTYKGERNSTEVYLRSPMLSDGEATWVSYEVEGVRGLGFDFCLESEADSDYLIVYVDDEEKMRLSGSHWGESKILLFPDDGKHIVKWVYQRDTNGNRAQLFDCVFIHFDGVEDIVKSHFKNDKKKPWVKTTCDDGVECLKASGTQNGVKSTFEIEITPEMDGASLHYWLKDSSSSWGGRGSLTIYVNGQKELEASWIVDDWSYFDYNFNVGDKVKIVFSVNDYLSEDEVVSCLIQIPCMDDYFSVNKDLPDDEQAQVEEEFFLDLRTGRDAQRTILNGDDGVSFATQDYSAWVNDRESECMRSPELKAGASSWMAATVVGKGTFSFTWRASGGVLICYVDGEEKETLSGGVDWAQVDLALEEDARHEIKWVYSRDEDATEMTYGWVDGIVWDAPEGWDDPDEPIVPCTVSTFIPLDLRSSPRLIQSLEVVERIAYDPAWVKAASAELTIGKTDPIVVTTAGTQVWTPTEEGLVTLILTFKDASGNQVGEALRASFKVATGVLPDLGETATAEEVAVILKQLADSKLAQHLTTVDAYEDFRKWVNAQNIADEDVKISLLAWLSYALDANELIADTPKADDLKVEGLTQADRNGVLRLTFTLEGVEIGEDAIKRLAQVFEVLGGSQLAAEALTADQVETTYQTPEEGKVKVKVKPLVEDGQVPPSNFFFRVKMKE